VERLLLVAVELTAEGELFFLRAEDGKQIARFPFTQRFNPCISSFCEALGTHWT